MTEISDAAWNRQKRWELKREVLFDATKRLAEVSDALTVLGAMASEQATGGGVGADQRLKQESRGRLPRLIQENFRYSYRLILRRNAPTAPKSPVPSSKRLDGSGTVDPTDMSA